MTNTTNTSSIERIPPQDIAAEKATLGGMILSKDAIDEVADIITNTSEYYRPAHRLIHTAILALHAQGEPVDPHTLTAELTKRGHLVRAGGPGYISGLPSETPSGANAGYHAQIVQEKAALRRLVEAGTRIAEMGYAGEGETNEVVAAALAELAAATDAPEDHHAGLIGELVEPYLDELDSIQKNGTTKGVPTGFADLDALTEGLHPGQFIIVAGRPALGKSTLGLDFARAAAITNDRPTALFSLEMDRTELMHRLMSAQARIALHHMRHKGGMIDDDWTRFVRVMPRVTAAPLTIDDNPYQTVARIKAKCHRLKQNGGLDLVVIDYLQLLEASQKRGENRQQEVSDMSRSLKLMAKELQVPVVVLAQLNRGPEQRQDKKPVASDLRESGSLEQDADLIILLHREDAHLKESPRAGEADLIVAKHRNGPTATITVAFQGHYSRFVDMSRDVT